MTGTGKAKILTMSFNDISPHLRYINLKPCRAGVVAGPRKLYDHHFTYIHKGQGMMEIDGVSYEAAPGDLFFYGPGVVHKITSDDKEPLLLSGIQFDVVRNYRDEIFLYPYDLDAFEEGQMTERVEFTDFCGFPPCQCLSFDQRVGELVMEMVKEYQSGRIYSYNCINGLFSQWLSLVARHTVLKSRDIPEKDFVVNNLLQFIRDNFNRNINNREIGERFHFHHDYLNRLVVAHTGLSLHQYVIDLRIKKAMELIMNSNMSVTEIAQEVGYADMHYFSRLFKEKTGFPPNNIRKK